MENWFFYQFSLPSSRTFVILCTSATYQNLGVGWGGHVASDLEGGTCDLGGWGLYKSLNKWQFERWDFKANLMLQEILTLMISTWITWTYGTLIALIKYLCMYARIFQKTFPFGVEHFFCQFIYRKTPKESTVQLFRVACLDLCVYVGNVRLLINDFRIV